MAKESPQDEVETPDIQTTEFGYYLISELISMDDRKLAEELELAIWKDGFQPVPEVLAHIIERFKESGGDFEFQEEMREYLKNRNSGAA